MTPLNSARLSFACRVSPIAKRLHASLAIKRACIRLPSLVMATVFGLCLGHAVVLHEGSTLLVVFNALRLLAYRNK